MARIAILLPDLRGGGAERVSLDLAFALRSLGHEVDFTLMMASGDFLPLVSSSFLIFDLNARRVREVPFALARYLGQRKPEAVIANMWPLTSAAALGRLLSSRTVRLLLVEHCCMSQQYAIRGRMHNAAMRTSMAVTYRMADSVAGVSEGVARDIERIAARSYGSVSVLHNPIPRPKEPQETARSKVRSLWGTSGGKKILTVGNLKDQKNHQMLLRSFAQIANSSATLMLLGRGQNEPMLRALARELGIADRVLFAGFHTDPSPFYATADLFVLSSDYEGFGNVIVEALSFGLPVVSTDCPSGPAEILENGRWGRLTPVGDVEALARAMDEALSTPVDREALKRRAADFSPEIAARKYLDLLGLS